VVDPGREASPSEDENAALLRAYLAARDDLVRFFSVRLRSREVAEDLVQEMYERVLRAPPDAPIGNPLAYLYRLGSNLMLDQARYDRRRMARETAWSALKGVRIGVEDVVDEPAADQVVAARQRLGRLLRLIDELPPQARRAFSLHKLEGRSHAETAVLMGVSRSAVEKHISAALKMLMARL
jgi:RNA polymerase sigma factor (sigma-70 family)